LFLFVSRGDLVGGNCSFANVGVMFSVSSGLTPFMFFLSAAAISLLKEAFWSNLVGDNSSQLNRRRRHDLRSKHFLSSKGPSGLL